MSFRPIGTRPLRRGWRAVLALGLLALAACGGGTSQYDAFQPQRVFAYGDENSLLVSGGRKYSVNALDTAGAVDCQLQPLWVQSVASLYGFVFAECNPDAVAQPQAFMRAAAGGRADDLSARIDAQVAAGGFNGNDLVLVQFGTNDVLDLYADFPNRSAADLADEAAQRGERLATQINRLVALGARVIVSTMPDVGLSPYGLAQQAGFTDTDRAALLTQLTAAFNGRLRTTILNDGRFIGLVLADEMVQAMSRAPGAFGLVNATAAVCNATPAPPDCSANTLVSGGSSASYLWSNDRYLAFGGHRQLALLAESRARNNPF